MILAVVGSRTFTNYPLLEQELDRYSTITRIVSGGAKGADTLAMHYAGEHEIDFREYIPNWARYGKSAGYKRNVFIVDACESLIAFWDGSSRGTRHSIDLAYKRRIHVRIVDTKRS